MTLATGIQQKFFGVVEVDYDTPVALLATHAMALDKLDIKPEEQLEPTNEKVGTASLQTEQKGYQSGKWSAIADFRPAAAGIAPDIGDLLLAAYGVEDIVGGTSVTYKFSDSLVEHTGLDSLSLARVLGTQLGEYIHGAWVEQVDIEVQGGVAPRVTFAGGFATYGFVYAGATVVGIEAIAETAIQLSAEGAKKCRKGAYCKFDTEDNGGAGYLITAVDYATDIITISPGLAGATEAADPVQPFQPSQTLAGIQIPGVSAGFSLDADPLGLISAKLSFTTGVSGLMSEVTTDRPNRLTRSRRPTTINATCFYLDENTEYIGGAWNGETRAVIIRLGPNVATERATLNVPKVRLQVTSPDVPEAEETTVEFQGMARQNAAAADEHTLVFD